MQISGLGKTPGTTGLSVRGSDVTAVQFKIHALEAELAQLNQQQQGHPETAQKIASVEQELKTLSSMRERLENGYSASDEPALRRASSHGIRQPGVGLNLDLRI